MLSLVRQRATFRHLYPSTFLHQVCTSPTRRPHFSRKFSTSNLEQPIRDYTRTLINSQPCFSMSSDDVRIIVQPCEFYETLLSMIKRAQRRIFVSSLYIGCGETELIAALHNALTANPDLHLYLILDLNRSTRPDSPSSSTAPTASSTATLLIPLLRAFPSRVHISLFRSPKLKGLLSRLVPPRFNEGWGTWHAKVYGVDDEVLISGANLNKSYFTNRQDRYIHFAAPTMAEYCFEFIRTASGFSYELLVPDGPDVTGSGTGGTGEYVLRWPDERTPSHAIHYKAHMALKALQERWLSQSRDVGLDETEDAKGNYRNESSKAAGEDVLVFPVIQAGQFGVREEERCVGSLWEYLASYMRPLSSTSDSNSTSEEGLPPTNIASTKAGGEKLRPLVDLTSGYFGLYEKYREAVLRAEGVDCRIVAASPLANGFLGSKGISGRIPEGYTFLERRFMKRVSAAGRSGDVELGEWDRKGWTYHAKGIWLSPTPTSPPTLTLVGSTNLNTRSAHLDTELSFLIVTSATAADANEGTSVGEGTTGLKERLRGEVAHLRGFVRPWGGGDAGASASKNSAPGRQVRWTTKVLVWLVGDMM